jgi:predicted alpha/beta superfamily hydrolase
MEEDFFHIAGIVRYNTQPWVNRFPRSIVVGIQNTDRKRDCSFWVDNLDFLDKTGFKKESFTSYGGSAKYIAFLENELLPFIDTNYKTMDNRTIIGESFAGLLTTEILLKHRQLFNTYIIITPSLWWGNELLLQEAPSLLQNNRENKINVYVGACNKDEDTTMYNEAVGLKDALIKYGGSETNVFYDYMADEIHSTVIHQAVYNAFKLIYPHTEYQK